MYRTILIVVRPDTSVPFWFQSGTQPSGYFSFGDQYVISGLMLDHNRVISADGLTFTRYMDFPDQASATTFFNAYATKYPQIQAEKKAYNAANNHIETVTFSTI